MHARRRVIARKPSGHSRSSEPTPFGGPAVRRWSALHSHGTRTRARPLSALSCAPRPRQGELGFFWATKIGGPSHGFDLEGQCLLPLLANARHKVTALGPKRAYHCTCTCVFLWPRTRSFN